MRNTMKTTVIYVPRPENAIDAEKWEAVEDALRAVGVTDIRRAPPQSLNYVPRQLRAPAVISTMEV
jgi:energy-coupling factor transporter ATP-binding protein EcfA2